MNVSRNFLLTGAVYILLGTTIGAYMGATGDYALTDAHPHINLIGFVLSVASVLVIASAAVFGWNALKNAS